MSITFVYRDENNKVQVKKIDYEEVKKDLMKYLSHDIRSIIKEKEEDEWKINKLEELCQQQKKEILWLKKELWDGGGSGSAVDAWQ